MCVMRGRWHLWGSGGFGDFYLFGRFVSQLKLHETTTGESIGYIACRKRLWKNGLWFTTVDQLISWNFCHETPRNDGKWAPFSSIFSRNQLLQGSPRCHIGSVMLEHPTHETPNHSLPHRKVLVPRAGEGLLGSWAAFQMILDVFWCVFLQNLCFALITMSTARYFPYSISRKWMGIEIPPIKMRNSRALCGWEWFHFMHSKQIESSKAKPTI